MNNNTKRRKRRRSINGRILIGLIIAAFFMCVGTSGFMMLRDTFEVFYIQNSTSFSYSHIAAAAIDGEDPKWYTTIGEDDESYQWVLNFLDSVSQAPNITDVYVMVPDNGGYHYVWYVGKNHDQSSNFCGRPVEISEKENDFFDRIINKEGEETILTLDDENGEPYFVACSPVLDKNKDVAAVAVVNLSNSIINDSLKRLIKDMNKFIAVFMIIIFLFIYISTNIGIVRPVKRLTKAASELVDDIESGREFSVDIHTNDEIEVLADAFLNMDADLRKYIKENNEITTERERMNAELNMASSIQSSSLPNVFPPFPNRKEFDIFALMEPAKMVGGDFYDFFFTDDDHLALVVADVSGKGIPAALFMMVSKTIIRSIAQTTDSPADILKGANAALSRDNREDMFVTVWLGILEVSTGKLTFANAGHERLAVCHDKTWSLMDKTHRGIALGMAEPDEFDDLPEKYRIVDQEIVLSSGDAIFQYTDGVTEATDKDNKLFGEERLLKALSKSQDDSATALLESVKKSVADFVNEAPQFDDITMLGLIFK